MNREELQQRARVEGIPDDFYSFSGKHPNEAYCLTRSGDGWEVYYSERGVERGTKQFSSEEDACSYLYGKLLKYAKKVD